jgi:HlyD family secretion protein
VISETPERDVVKRYVWLATGGKARKTAVTTGLSDDRWESISSGVKAGDRIIVGPTKTLRRLRDGESVAERKVKSGADKGDTADTGE